MLSFKETFLPEFKLVVEEKEFLSRLISSYREESQRLARRGQSVRCPVGILHCKIYHELMNYDIFRDRLTNARISLKRER